MFNIIPYFGPVFGILPAVLIALMMSPGKALWVLIGMIVIQQIEGTILSPKITGDSTEIHPFVIIILLLIYIDVKPPNNDNQSSVAFTFQVANVCGAR